MSDQFTEVITVHDEWTVDGEQFRLVYKGAGPMELQTINPHTNDIDWKPERDCYVHGVLCSRLIKNKKHTVKDAMETLTQAFEDDPDYAHTWHCNIACSVMDSGVDHEKSNEAASRFMKLAFGVETKG